MSTLAPPQRRRVLRTRACDRCRRRKARCDSDGRGAPCTPCRDGGALCTFDLPTAKRGPKGRRRSRPLAPSAPALPLDDGTVPAGYRPPRLALGLPLAGGPVALQSPPAIALAADAAAWDPDPTAAAATDGSGIQHATPESLSDHHRVVLSSSSSAAAARPSSCLQRWLDLSVSIQRRAPALALPGIAEKCLDLFFEYLFPLIPIVHEASLREALRRFATSSGGALDGDRHGPRLSVPPLWTSSSVHGGEATARLDDPPGGAPLGGLLWPEPAFTLLTAVCAAAAFLLPKEIFPEGDLVADALLQASRDCLQSYLEADLEEPDVGSLAVRYLHSNCLHAAGKPKFSWHIFGEAVRLAQVMQLHDEAAYEALPALEAELRRRAFWIVYLGDKSAALLNHRPITIHQYSFEAGITTSYPSGAEGEGTTAILPLPARPDLATTSAVSPPGPPHHHRSHHYDHHHPSLIVGFNANIRLWQSASDLLLALRLLRERQQQQQQQQQQHQQQQPPGVVSPVQHQQQQQHISPEDRSHINSLYVRFATCLDDLPPCLHARALLGPRDDPTTSSSSVPSPGGPRHHRQYVVQAANLQVTYHCLRMVITQRLEDHGYFLGGAGGGPDSVDMLVLRKTEIARDLLQIIRDAPFWALQVNGEPCVEKVRLVGASLLAIMHRNETSPLSLRARSDFSVLLDILARLDSKASDTLRSGY